MSSARRTLHLRQARAVIGALSRVLGLSVPSPILTIGGSQSWLKLLGVQWPLPSNAASTWCGVTTRFAPTNCPNRERNVPMVRIALSVWIAFCFLVVIPLRAEDDGLKTIAAAQDAATTVAQLEGAIRAGGMKVFARIDHAAAAKEFGLKMPPATVVIFGNPKGGTPNFLKQPKLAIDLPLKMLVWENAAGKTFITYNSGAYVFGKIFARHRLNPPAAVARGQEKMLSGLANSAAK